MRYGKTAAGFVLLSAAGILFFTGQHDLALSILPIGTGLVGIGLGHKVDRLLQALAMLKRP